jgi:hypothetical protein
LWTERKKHLTFEVELLDVLSTTMTALPTVAAFLS